LARVTATDAPRSPRRVYSGSVAGEVLGEEEHAAVAEAAAGLEVLEHGAAEAGVAGAVARSGSRSAKTEARLARAVEG